MSDTERPDPVAAAPRTLAGGRYALGDRLAADHLGLVLRATDEEGHDEVAVRLLADDLAADPDARERFLRAARDAGRVADPHIVAVLAVGGDREHPYLVTELVDGPSLADTLAAEGPLAPLEVAEVAADALAGLSRAHEAGVLHRDLGPERLLRTPDGMVRIADLGLADATPARSRPAPELTGGEPETVRTDLNALAATLVELVTGRAPRPADPLADLESHEDLPAGLRHLLERALASDPQQRPASAEAALALLAGEVAPAPAPVGGHAQVVTDAAEQDPPPAPATRPTGATDDAGTGAAGADPDESGTDRDESGADRTVAPTPPGDRPGSDVALPWRQVVGIAVLLLLVAVAFQVVGGEDTEPVDPVGVERSGDPAETARNLAQWLREQGGGP